MGRSWHQEVQCTGCERAAVPPNQPATPNRVVRVPDDLWDEAQVIADERGETMSEYVRRLIREDVRRWPGRID